MARTPVGQGEGAAFVDAQRAQRRAAGATELQGRPGAPRASSGRAAWARGHRRHGDRPKDSYTTPRYPATSGLERNSPSASGKALMKPTLAAA
jgi:hypothetical protein